MNKKSDLDDEINKYLGIKKKFSLSDYNFKVNEFRVRGLNKYRNILSAPKCEQSELVCECGCDGKGKLIINKLQELYDLCAAVLFDNGCGNSAIFLEHRSGKMEIVYCHVVYDKETEEPDLEISTLSPKKGTIQDNDFFSIFDAEERLHCYGLIIERDKGQWEICE